MVCRCTG